MNKLRIVLSILLLTFSTAAVNAQAKKPVVKKPVATTKKLFL